MMMRAIVFALLAVLPCASGMAKWMTKEECGKQIRVGEVIMGSEAKPSDKRTIKVQQILYNKPEVFLTSVLH